ncbi:MAG: anaerobic ribonucleoside-triphosphate reductase [Halanaerobiales bacterium]
MSKKQKCEVYSRIVGYLSPVSEWNDGKQEEYKDRKTYSINDKIKKNA